MNLLLIIMIGVSLSLDAFSLSISYGLMNIEKKKIVIQSIIVGLFHFFMPLIGNIFGKLIVFITKVDMKYLVVIIFSFIIISILKNIKEKETNYELNLIGMLFFGLAVSIDSFSIGISLNYISNSLLLGPVVFMFLSGVITYLGFRIGKYISERVGVISKVISALLLTCICIYILIH